MGFLKEMATVGFTELRSPMPLMRRRCPSTIACGYWEHSSGAQLCIAGGYELVDVDVDAGRRFGVSYYSSLGKLSLVVVALATPRELRRRGSAGMAMRAFHGVVDRVADGEPWSIHLEVCPLRASGPDHVRAEVLRRFYAGLGYEHGTCHIESGIRPSTRTMVLTALRPSSS